MPISVVEVAGAVKIREAVQNRMNLISIFLTLEEKERENRLRERWGMTEEDIRWRLEEGIKEQRFISQYDLQIENTKSPETAKLIAQITSDMIIWRTREDIRAIYNVFGGITN